MVVWLLFRVVVPDEAHVVEIRPVFTGSSRPRVIFRGPLVRYGHDLDDNDIADIISRDVRFWRWIRSEDRARRFRSLRNGSAVSFRLALWFFDENNKLITLDRTSGRTHAVTHSEEQFDNETSIRF